MMTSSYLSFQALLEEYQVQAESLFNELQSGDENARSRFKWEHPHYRGKSFEEVQPDALDLCDAQLVLAREYGFSSWGDLAAFSEAIQRDPATIRFENAVEAVVKGDLSTLRQLLREDPGLVHARSSRRHHCTLLHYLGANGVEGWRQKTPENAVMIAKTLLDAGAHVDALADLYDHQCTTMSMLVSSCHPHAAGLQIPLAELLLDHGAALDGVGTEWQSPVLTALIFGYPGTAEAIVRRGAPVDTLPVAAGLGRLDDCARLLPLADDLSRHRALALGAQLGQVEVVRLLLDAGVDPNRKNPKGYHDHATPLHHAVWFDHPEVVRLLVERGARVDVRDSLYQSTPLGWAEHGGKQEMVEYLRGKGVN